MDSYESLGMLLDAFGRPAWYDDGAGAVGIRRGGWVRWYKVGADGRYCLTGSTRGAQGARRSAGGRA